MTGPDGTTPRRRLRFVKMHGAGNDYVYVDDFAERLGIDRAAELAARLADRHRGVGGDGLILVTASHDPAAACRMVMWNADGSRGSMCGNGLRCVARLARENGIAAADAFTISTDAGPRPVELQRTDDGAIDGVRIAMGDVTLATAGAEDVLLDDGVDGQRPWAIHRADAGNPHAVVFVDDDLAALPLERLGPAFQRLPMFPDGVNVEFVRVVDASAGVVEQRTFERGSGETLACGTGATAAAVVAVRTGRCPGPRVVVRLLGGDLAIETTARGTWMTGPAERVFAGVIEV